MSFRFPTKHASVQRRGGFERKPRLPSCLRTWFWLAVFVATTRSRPLGQEARFFLFPNWEMENRAWDGGCPVSLAPLLICLLCFIFPSKSTNFEVDRFFEKESLKDLQNTFAQRARSAQLAEFAAFVFKTAHEAASALLAFSRISLALEWVL